jgi:hypothetical protein
MFVSPTFDVGPSRYVTAIRVTYAESHLAADFADYLIRTQTISPVPQNVTEYSYPEHSDDLDLYWGRGYLILISAMADFPQVSSEILG